jgi:pimeloyl-ACP methyl ester carboxylesterase
VAAVFERAQVNLEPVMQCVQEMPPERLTRAVGDYLDHLPIDLDEPSLVFHAWDGLIATCLGQAGPRG